VTLSAIDVGPPPIFVSTAAFAEYIEDIFFFRDLLIKFTVAFNISAFSALYYGL
jgi:hypothetical protein